jgi:hypothetical protein
MSHNPMGLHSPLNGSLYLFHILHQHSVCTDFWIRTKTNSTQGGILKICITAKCTGKLLDSLSETVLPVKHEGHMLLASFCTCFDPLHKPAGQQIRNKIHQDHRRCQNWCPLICMCSLHLCKMFTFTHLSSFLERGETKNLKVETPDSCAMHLRNFWEEYSGLIVMLYIFTSVNVWHFHLVLFVCQNLFAIVWIVFSIWNWNTQKFMSESSPYFSHRYYTWPLNSTCNPGTR